MRTLCGLVIGGKHIGIVSRMPLVGLLVNENVKHHLYNDAPKILLVHLLKP
jgi:hypothetical protein